MSITKTKVGIATLALISFIVGIVGFIVGIVGGFALNAYQVSAFGGRGFFKSRCNLSGLEKGSAEWQAKLEECKAERKAKIEELKAQMEELKAMTPEERQAKIKELKANWPENMPFKRRGMMFRRMFRPKWLKGASYQIQNLDNGVQITITSDNADTVTKLQEWAAKLPVANQ